MTLKQTLTEDMKNAMRARDSLTLQAIRYLLAEIKNVEIDNGEQDDKGVEKIIASQVKKIKEAIEEFKKGNRDDLVQEEEKKLLVLKKYLPEQMGDQQLEQIIKKIVADNQGLEMGPMIGKVMVVVKGQADGGRVSELVRKLM